MAPSRMSLRSAQPLSDGTYGVLYAADRFETAYWRPCTTTASLLARTHGAGGRRNFGELVLSVKSSLHDLRGGDARGLPRSIATTTAKRKSSARRCARQLGGIGLSMPAAYTPTMRGPLSIANRADNGHPGSPPGTITGAEPSRSYVVIQVNARSQGNQRGS